MCRPEGRQGARSASRRGDKEHGNGGMPNVISETTIKNVLTRTTGFLRTVTSHSLQPYCGCTFGRALCGVGCYVQHNGRLLRGRPWGGFLEVRTNAAASYLANYESESRWARRNGEDAGRP